MALKAVLESLDDVPEALLPEYKEVKTGDKTVYVLDVSDHDAHPHFANLKRAHVALQGRRDALAAEVATLKDKAGGVPEDFDADEWNRLRAEDEARKNDPGNKDVAKQIETAVAAARAQEQTKAKATETRLNGEITKLKGENEKKDGQIRARLVDDELTRALTESGVTSPSFLRASSAMLKGDIEVVEEDGQYAARMKADLGGGDVKSYVSNWTQTDEGKSFVAPAKGGDERGGSGNKNSGPNPFAKDAWNKTEQGKIMMTDRAKAERLAKAAGFASLDIAKGALKPL